MRIVAIVAVVVHITIVAIVPAVIIAAIEQSCSCHCYYCNTPNYCSGYSHCSRHNRLVL